MINHKLIHNSEDLYLLEKVETIYWVMDDALSHLIPLPVQGRQIFPATLWWNCVGSIKFFELEPPTSQDGGYGIAGGLEVLGGSLHLNSTEVLFYCNPTILYISG